MKKELNIIFGAFEAGKNFKDYATNKNVNIDFFVDNNPEKQNLFEGIEVLSVEKLLQLAKKNCVNVYIAANAIGEIVHQLKEMNFEGKVYGIKKEDAVYIKSDSDVVYPIDICKPRLSYIEYEVSHHCNLRCKGCSHFSNLEQESRFGDFNQFKADLYRLKELFWGVRIIRLLGGEPLLNPNVCDFFVTARNIFPDARIQVVSNGIYIPTLDKRILEQMKQYNIEFDITQYIPTSKIKDRIEEVLQEYKIQYHLSALVTEFFDRNNFSGDSDIEASFACCTSKGCHFLEDGHIATCPRPFVFLKVSDIYNIDTNVLRKDIIDIYDKEMTGEILNKRLEQALETCRYCFPQEKLKFFEWQGNCRK